MFERRVVLGQFFGLTGNGLLDKEIEERPKQLEITWLDAEIDRQGTLAQIPPVEVIARSRRIDQRMGEEIEPAGEGLANGRGGDGSQVHDVGDRAYALRRKRIAAALPARDDAVPMSADPLRITPHALAQYLSECCGKGGGFEHVEPEA